MTESENSLFRRIRSAKNSLENAEQSFLDNKSMRGELDLMLAEAELKNLRRKKEVPWNWNRQLLALCGAILLCIAGFGGWMFAKGEEETTTSAPIASPAVESSKKVPSIQKETEKNTTPAVVKTQESGVDIKNKPEAEGSSVAPVSSEEMRRLVRSARVELSKTK